jgi:hypothetical protein
MDASWYERLSEPGFLHRLETRTMDDLRSMRSASGRIEAQLSFARRMVQGRLDIVEAERIRRAKGLSPSNLAELVAALPAMLSGRVQSEGSGFRSRDVGDHDDPMLEAKLDSILDGGALMGLPASSDAQLAAVASRLVEFEREVSDQRRLAIHAYEALSAEVIRRFRDGEVPVESVLQ